MNKKSDIILVYDKELRPTDVSIVEVITSQLKDDGFENIESSVIGDIEEDGLFVDGILERNIGGSVGVDGDHRYNPQLIVSVNMAGFRTKMSDGSPYINKLPLNIIVYIDKLSDDMKERLRKRIVTTTHFLVKDERAFNYIRENRPDLLHVERCLEMDTCLTKYLDELELRF